MFFCILEITVTYDWHMAITSSFEDDHGPKTRRVPFSVEGDKLTLHFVEGDETRDAEFSFGFCDSGDRFLDGDTLRFKYRRR